MDTIQKVMHLQKYFTFYVHSQSYTLLRNFAIVLCCATTVALYTGVLTVIVFEPCAQWIYLECGHVGLKAITKILETVCDYMIFCCNLPGNNVYKFACLLQHMCSFVKTRTSVQGTGKI